MNPWFKDADEMREHHDIVLDPSRWPMGDWLHMKHPDRIMHGDEDRFGAIHSGDPLVIVAQTGRTYAFTSVEEMFEAGWVVD